MNCTGWRIGWAIGPEYLVKYINGYLQWATFGSNRPCSKAFSYAFESAELPYHGYANFYEYSQKTYTLLINEFYNILQKHSQVFGWRNWRAMGGYFTISDITNSIRHLPIKYFYKDIENVTNGDKR